MQPGDVYRQHRKITWSKKWNKWCTDYVAVLSSSKPHLGWCNRNSATLSVRSENPRASFLSLQIIKTNSLKRIDFKQPGSFGLPTWRHVMATISSYTNSLHRTKFTNIYWIFTKYLQTYKKRQQEKVFTTEAWTIIVHGLLWVKAIEIWIPCYTKFAINVPRRAMHQGWKWAFKVAQYSFQHFRAIIMQITLRWRWAMHQAGINCLIHFWWGGNIAPYGKDIIILKSVILSVSFPLLPIRFFSFFSFL